MKILSLLLIPVLSFSQAPSDFVQVYDSITFVADPAYGKQVIYSTKLDKATFQMPKGKYKIGLYTKSATPIEKYLHFSGFMTDSVDTSNNPTVNIEIVPSNYLVIVPVNTMASGKIPLLRIGTLQYQMWLNCAYYYCYLKRTTVAQVFSLDITGSGANLIKLEPVPGGAYVYAPLTQTVTINLINPFK